jgi:hypothetical protein
MVNCIVVITVATSPQVLVLFGIVSSDFPTCSSGARVPWLASDDYSWCCRNTGFRVLSSLESGRRLWPIGIFDSQSAIFSQLQHFDLLTWILSRHSR